MFDPPPPDPGVEIVIASRGMSKGLAQTEGPQFVPRAFLQVGALQLGGQWKNVTSPVAEGEGAAFANITRKIGSTQLAAGVTYKFQTSVREPTDDKALELNGSITHKIGKLSARASVVYSPDDFGSGGRSIFYEAGPSFDIFKSAKIFANLGRRERRGSPDYTAFNAGISTVVLKGVTLEGRYYDTAQSELGEPYRGRAVGSVRLSF